MSFMPFSKTDSHSAFRGHLEKRLQEIDSLENGYVLRCSQTELEQHYCDDVAIEPLALAVEDQFIQDQKAIEIDVSHDFRRAVTPGRRAVVSGTRIELAIPFVGDPELWNVRPSTFSLSGYPQVEVKKDHIVIGFEFPDDDAQPERLKRDIEQVVSHLAETVKNLNRDVAVHNDRAPAQIRQRLERKREKALAATNAVTGLGIPMKREAKPPSYAIPVQRRRSPVTKPKPKPSTEQYKTEPFLDEAEYEHILEVIRSMSHVIERDPKTFRGLDEESIRVHFLIQLNGHYRGSATGETFNAAGKTDILIRENDRNVFIAECKFWTGPKGFNDAIDQLLSYLTWRDCKCALLIFNRNKDAAAVAEKMHAAMTDRSEHRKTEQQSAHGTCRYVFVKDDEPGREITITTMLFNIPNQ